jgi:predicted nucleotidyltransferase
MTHTTFSRRGGKVRSPRKTAANRAKAVAYWQAVRLGTLPKPLHLKVPPSPETIAKLLAGFCRENGIIRLEIFGSTARGDARPGSDVDLLARFARNPGLRFFALGDEMAGMLGAPVHLLTQDSIAQMSNPYRRESILAGARIIYES